jgi:mannitol/fructose-specific phosphotransferase system IIA component (Ntr-type)
MAITQLLTLRRILPALRVADKDELFRAMVDTFDTELDRDRRDSLLRAIVDRERVMSTGVGKGFALPHGRCDAIDRHLGAFAVLESPLEYDNHHPEPVRLVFLLAGPSGNSSEHIRIMSRISRLFNHDAFREKLAGCRTSDDVMEVFTSYEAAHGG